METKLIKAIESARSAKLAQCMYGLECWLAERQTKQCNTETTLSMLEHKVKEIEDRVDRAGLKACRESKHD